MASINDAFPSKFLKSGDFPQAQLLTIKTLDFDKVGDDRKPILFFWELDKGLVLNKTNASMVTQIARTDDYTQWSNIQVEAYVKPDVEFQGSMVAAIRIRPPTPTQDLSAGQQHAAQLGQPNALTTGPQHQQGAPQPPQAQQAEYRHEEQTRPWNDEVPF